MKNRTVMNRRVTELRVMKLPVMVACAFLCCWAGWTDAPDQAGISLRGVRETTVEVTEIREALDHPSHRVTIEVEVKGELRTYSGVPLRMLIAGVDGPDHQHPYAFDEELWRAGYDVTIEAADGYAVTFSSAALGPDDLILAVEQDGAPISPMVVGDVSRGLWVKDAVSIELGLGSRAVRRAAARGDVAADTDPAFELVVETGAGIEAFTIAELLTSPYYVEGPGGFVTSAGSKYTGVYGGVALVRFLGQFVRLRPEDTVVMQAMDGYRMSYSGEQFLDASNGMWLLAFRLDGEFLEYDPGYVRTVKIGPSTPVIDGHLSVKMIERVVVEQSSYRDFDVVLTGAMDVRLDRQTVQSCVNCHARTVRFERKKTSGDFTGVALWRLLAYSDDPEYAPHRQDDSIVSYNAALAEAGYEVRLVAADGYAVGADSRLVDRNDDIIVATLRDGEELGDDEWPLVLVWQVGAEIPESLKPIKQITAIELGME